MKNLEEKPVAHPRETLLFHTVETSSYEVVEKPTKYRIRKHYTVHSLIGFGPAR